MAIFKCKMCGADLNVQDGMSVVECSYCGTTQTVSATDDEKRVNLYNRANRLRLSNEFDKAAGVYEAIVAEFPEEAEAYWGLLLCHYGVEYVDDPVTARKVPTCHRSSFESVMDDQNLDLACEYADITARHQYREEAKQLEEIRKGIIEVSSKEEPYDIFICYKETDDKGERTLDSVMAQDVYAALTEKGYKVFFSRISLEDKLGTEYEPYIFAALNSAKVMLAFGTNYEYYNAVWVKNEWSRFLRLMAAGQKKTLIPCYKNLDAYDIPKEFAKLQAQDMGKVGAMQDLLRGIDKIFGRDKQAVMAAPAQEKSYNTNLAADTLLKQGYALLKQQQFSSASSYFTKVIERAPATASAYWGKLLCRHQCIDSLDLCGKTKTDSFVNGYFESDAELDCNPEKLKNVIRAQLDPEYTDAISNASEHEKQEYIDVFEKIYQLALPCAEKLFQERKKQIEAKRKADRKAAKRRNRGEKKIFIIPCVVYLVVFVLTAILVSAEDITEVATEIGYIKGEIFIYGVLAVSLVIELLGVLCARRDHCILAFVIACFASAFAGVSFLAFLETDSALWGLLLTFALGLFDFIFPLASVSLDLD